MNLFEKKPTPKEQMRASQRDIGKGVRDLERELHSLKTEEQRLIKEIKKAATSGNQPSTRILAKSLVRVRGQQTKIHAGIAQMRGVSSGMHSAAATATVGQSMASASKAMEAMGKVSDPAKMAAIMRQFGMENEKMDMSSEMMGDAIDDAMDDGEAEGEADDVVNQVLDDIGVDLSGKMSAVPRSRLRQGQAAASSSGASEEDTELMRRLAALK